MQCLQAVLLWQLILGLVLQSFCIPTSDTQLYKIISFSTGIKRPCPELTNTMYSGLIKAAIHVFLQVRYDRNNRIQCVLSSMYDSESADQVNHESLLMICNKKTTKCSVTCALFNILWIIPSYFKLWPSIKLILQRCSGTMEALMGWPLGFWAPQVFCEIIQAVCPRPKAATSH